MVGKGCVLDDGMVVIFKVKVGDIVFFGKYVGIEIKFDGEEYFIM